MKLGGKRRKKMNIRVGEMQLFIPGSVNVTPKYLVFSSIVVFFSTPKYFSCNIQNQASCSV